MVSSQYLSSIFVMSFNAFTFLAPPGAPPGVGVVGVRLILALLVTGCQGGMVKLLTNFIFHPRFFSFFLSCNGYELLRRSYITHLLRTSLFIREEMILLFTLYSYSEN